MTFSQLHRPHRGGLELFIVLVGIVGLAACDDILDVDVPSEIIAEDLDDPANAQLLVTSLVADFECAFGEYVVAGGLTGEELADAALTVSGWQYDRRDSDPAAAYGVETCENRNEMGVYRPLQTARFQADRALSLLEGWTDQQVLGRGELTATAAAYAGYSYLIIGEAMCSAAFDLGPELQKPEIFAIAEQRFTRAIEAARSAGATEVLNMALVGRARARLNSNDGPGAVEDAGQVPEGFVREATYSTTDQRRENDVFFMNVESGGLVTVEEDYRGLTWQGVPDPRVEVVDTGELGSDNVIPLWLQTKYGSLSDPIPIARWAEAQLIIAEVEGGATAVDVINRLHAMAGLPPFDSTDPAEIQAHVIQERQRELFLESHHLWDLQRFELPLTPPPGTPFPPKAGGTYGDQRCFLLPELERQNNPNI